MTEYPSSYQIGTLGALTVCIVVHPTYQSRQSRLFRLSVFILTGLSAFAPIIHASRLFPLEQTQQAIQAPLLLCRGRNHLRDVIPGKALSGTLRYLGQLPPDIPRFLSFWLRVSHLLGVFECV